ncbi:MAG: hypothetical protein ACNYZG_09455 [Gammaproteobacteria bacterium]
MSKINSLPSEAAAVVATIDPDTYTAAAYTSDYIDMGLFERAQFVVMTGTLGTAATVDASIVQATTAAGAGSKALTTSKAITQLVKATNDDDQAIINVLAEDLDLANSFDFCAITVTVGVATSDVGAIGLGFNPRYAPASDNDLASVVEIVS